MTTAEFNKIVASRLVMIEKVLAAKASEYARGDRLSNFKRAAAMMKVSPERALLGMMAKHWVSVLDFIDDIDIDILHGDWEWDEKLGDSINYLILLEALAAERQAKRETCLIKEPRKK